MRLLHTTGRKGFTLIEVLMAVLLGGLILTAAASFVFGIFHLTIVAEKEPMFEEHVDATSRFLEFAFSSALPAEENTNRNTSANEGGEGSDQRQQPDTPNPNDSSSKGSAVAWKRIPGESGLNPEALSFRLSGDLPIFVHEEQAFLPDVECWLVFNEDEGLVLRWRTDEMAEESDDETLTAVISPFVDSLTYWYYDQEDDRWEDSDEAEEADEGGKRMPDFIVLTYKHPDEREAKRQLLLPASDSDYPLP